MDRQPSPPFRKDYAPARGQRRGEGSGPSPSVRIGLADTPLRAVRFPVPYFSRLPDSYSFSAIRLLPALFATILLHIPFSMPCDSVCWLLTFPTTTVGGGLPNYHVQSRLATRVPANPSFLNLVSSYRPISIRTNER